MTRAVPMKMDQNDRVGVAVGNVIARKYRVERVLGVGGMGYVVAARHLQLEESFALKFLHREFLSRGGVAERFTREARAACRIKSEYVARVYDVGSHLGAPFLVMEYLEGHDLSTVLHQRGRLPVEEAIEYAVQTC